MNKPQKVHFIGICGVGTSALATAFWNAGWKVTGSDKGFFPPISTALSAAGIPYYAGWHPEKMLKDSAPDFVIAGGAGTSPNNPEIIAAKEAKIPILSFAEAVGKYIIRPHSIVVAGTWGKSTGSALLAHIFESAHMNPSFFCGGLPVGSPAGVMRAENPTDKDNVKGTWSIVEGDEYKSAIWDNKPKFSYYKPTHLLLTSTNWDHADLYPTEKSYFDAFKKLVSEIPTNGQTETDGLIVYCADNENAKKIVGDKTAISYGASSDATYRYENVVQTKEGITFDIIYHGRKYNIKSSLLGAYNAENITGCFAMAKEIGIAPGDITDGIKSFQGMKRRLEKRYEHLVTVIDDIAHSPEKASSVLANLRSVYHGSLIAVYEPNTGNRTLHSVPLYKGAFAKADTVIIPRLTKLKVDESAKPADRPFDGDKLAEVIVDGHEPEKPVVQYMPDDEALVKFLTTDRKEGDVIVFLGSHGFRGMIEETVKKLALGA